MKKALSIIFMFLLMGVALAQSPPVPAPVIGKFQINDRNVAGYVLEVENLRTEEVISGDGVASLVTESGGFMFDLSYFDKGYTASIPNFYPGDPIEVRVRGFGDEGKYTFNVPDKTPYRFTLSIHTTREDAFVECYDGSLVREVSLCPAKPEPTVTEPEVVEKEVIKEVETEIEVPVPEERNLQDWLIGLIAGIIGVFAWGAGFAGLIRYYLRLAKEAEKAGNKTLAKKYRTRAEKMAKTAVTNFLAGKYKK